MHLIYPPFLAAVLLTASVMPVYAQLDPTTKIVRQPCPNLGSIRISIQGDGKVKIDGENTEPEVIDKVINARRKDARAICIYRQETESIAPHPNAFRVTHAAGQLRLPIMFFVEGTFQMRVVKRK